MSQLRFFLLVLLLAAVGITEARGQEMSDTNTPDLPDFDTLWDYNNPGATRAQFEAIRDEAQKSGDKSYYLQLLTQISRTLSLDRKFQEAHALLDTVESSLTDDLKLARVRYLLERGRTFRSSGEVAKAIPLFDEAYDIGQGIRSDYFAIDAAHMVAISVDSAQERMKWNLECIKIAEASSEPRARKWLGSIYNNIGWDYHDAKEYDKALEMFEKALAFRIEQGKETEINIAKWCVARTYRSLGRIDEAMEIQEALLKRNKELDQPDGYVSEELAELYLLKGDSATAKTHFVNAYNLLSQDEWFVSGNPERLARLKEMAGIKE